MLIRTKYIKSLQRVFRLTTRSLSYSRQNVIINPKCTEKNREFVEDVMSNDFGLYLKFINVNDEEELMKDVAKSFRRTKYEYNHWDGVNFLGLFYFDSIQIQFVCSPTFGQCLLYLFIFLRIDSFHIG